MAIFIRCKAKGCSSRRDLVLGTDKCPACGADLRRADSRSYRVIVWFKGRRYTNGRAPNLVTAQKIELEYRQNAALGRHPKRMDSLTLTDAWLLLLPKTKEPKLDEGKKTWDVDYRRWNNYLEGTKLAQRKLEDIDQDFLLKFINGLEESKSRRGTPYAQATLRHVYALVRKIFIWAAENGHFHGDRPTLCIKVKNEVDNPLMPDQCAKLLAVADEYSGRGYDQRMAGAAVMFLMLTGRRRGEVFGLKWQNVRPELNGVIYRKTKNGRDLRTPLSGHGWQVVESLRSQRLEECELVWHRADGGSFYHSFTPHFRAMLKLAGLADRGLRPHDLRHTFGSLLAASSIGAPVIKSLMGHGAMKSTERYMHPEQYPEQMTAVLNELARIAGAKQSLPTEPGRQVRPE